MSHTLPPTAKDSFTFPGLSAHVGLDSAMQTIWGPSPWIPQLPNQALGELCGALPTTFVHD